MIKVAGIDTKKVSKGVYEIVGLKTAENELPVFVTCIDNREITKRDFGWHVAEGKPDNVVTETFDRRTKALMEVSKRFHDNVYILEVKAAKDDIANPAGDSKPSENPLTEGAAANPGLMETLSTDELLMRHNAIAKDLGYKELAAWSKSKSGLVERIAKLEGERKAA